MANDVDIKRTLLTGAAIGIGAGIVVALIGNAFGFSGAVVGGITGALVAILLPRFLRKPGASEPK